MRVTYKVGVYVPPVHPDDLAEIARKEARCRRQGARLDPERHLHRERRKLAKAQAQAPRARSFQARRLLARGMVISAVMAVAAGCASLNPDIAKSWKIEPVLNVAHTLQSSQAYYTMGRYHDGSQAWDKSIEAYRKSIAADAQNIEAYNALGVALARGGRLADAETTLRQATALDPSRAHVRSNLGYVLLLAGKPGDAVVELRGALMQDAGNQGAMANLRDALEKRNASIPFAGQLSTAEKPAVATPQPPAGVADNRISVPAPITAVVLPMPASGSIDVAAPLHTVSLAAPLQTASVPAPLTGAVVGAMGATAETETPTEAVTETVTEVIRVVDKPTVGSLQDAAPETPNRRLVRQSLVRTVEVPASVAQEALFRLEVSNGNGVTGMAARVGKWLGEQGVVKTAHLTNQKPFQQETTIVQYRSGQLEAAQRVARSLPAPAVAEPTPTAGLRGDVRVVLGHDWVKVGACLDQKTCRPADTALAEAAPAR